MMQKTFILTLMFFTLILSGCQEKTVAKKSSSGNSLVCSGQAYWTTPGCTGYCQYQPTAAGCGGTTTGGTTGGALNCSGNAYWTTAGCAGFCSNYPSNSACGGTTTTGGSTTGATCTTASSPLCSNYCSTFPSALGCLPNGTNCWISPSAAGCPGSSTALNPQWGKHYPGGEPSGSCSQTYSNSTSALPVRQATITAASTYGYNPLTASNYLNTSAMLLNVQSAKTFFMTDSLLKVRVKVKPQQELTGNASPLFCYGRVRPGARIPGYTLLRYDVKVYGVSASNSLSYLGTAGTFTTGVNSCSQAIDLSYFKEVSPTGVVITIDNVKANQNCWPSSYNGYASCTSDSHFTAVRSFDCWGVDLEVAADGTKTFD